MVKKILFIISIGFLVISCADTFDSVKRGLTGAKSKSTDEFLIEKKDPLILPPDFENLPVPDEDAVVSEEISVFEKSLEITTENDSSTSTSTEDSILKKIQSK